MHQGGAHRVRSSSDSVIRLLQLLRLRIRTNKKAEVIAMMKRGKDATLAEIINATGWQPHTVRGFVSIRSKGGEKIESPKNAQSSA
jgi:hypothetical protein